MKVKYFKELDGIRGTAALMVMYFHFFIGIHSNNSFVKNVIAKTAVFGQTGVILFFVLSGFLITRILLSAKDQSNYFSNFYIRRSLRIFPLYYFALCIYLLSASFLHEETSSATWYFWSYLQNIAMTFKLNIGGPLHFWSLAVEEHFYLFWPVVIYYTAAKHLPAIIASVVIFSIIIRILLFYNGYEVFYFTGTTMDALAIGAMLAIKEKDNSLFKRSQSFYLYSFLSIIAATIVLWSFSGGKGLLFIQAFKGTFVAFIYFLLLALVISLKKNSAVKNFLNHRFLLFTGKISYGLYVYHVLCFSFYLKYLKSSYLLLDFVGCFILSYVVSSVSYYFFEVRFLKLKDRWARKEISIGARLSLQPAS